MMYTEIPTVTTFMWTMIDFNQQSGHEITLSVKALIDSVTKYLLNQ